MELLKLVLTLAATILVVQADYQTSNNFTGNIWAVLVAGSNGYDNYRHQADVCHAFQVLKSHGIPEERIIVMMYDDIAQNEENPTKGIIINQPGGKDVYKGVPKDYIGRDVTPKNFLKVLLGDKDLAKQGRKILNSTANDHVFIYFADHGAPGLVAFPSEELYANELIKTLKTMNQNGMFKKLLFYVEACESGSMFNKILPDNINILGVTAANEEESSYACYFDEERDTYLGDVFSVDWIEDSDKHRKLDDETVQQQFLVVKEETNTSHVKEYGDMTISKLPLGEFQGEKESSFDSQTERVNPTLDAVPSYDVPLMIVNQKFLKAKNPIEKAKLKAKFQSMVNARTFMTNGVKALAKKLESHPQIPANADLFNEKRALTRFECYEALARTFDDECFDLSTHPYALRFLYILVNTCEVMQVEDEKSVVETYSIIRDHCQASKFKAVTQSIQ